jgi:hypothetical protein
MGPEGVLGRLLFRAGTLDLGCVDTTSRGSFLPALPSRVHCRPVPCRLGTHKIDSLLASTPYRF